MSEKIYVKDYWRTRELIIARSGCDTNLIAIGECTDCGERFIHIDRQVLLKALKKLKVIK